MTIGIDFDNTLVDTWKLFKNILDNNGYHISNFYNINKEVNDYLIKNYSYDMCFNIDFFDDFKEVYNYLKEKNIKVVLITARGVKNPEIIPWTKEVLINKGYIFDKYIFKAEDKGIVCKENNIDLMIDDSEKVLNKVKKYHINTLKYGKKSNRFSYALNWEEVLKYIKERM